MNKKSKKSRKTLACAIAAALVVSLASTAALSSFAASYAEGETNPYAYGVVGEDGTTVNFYGLPVLLDANGGDFEVSDGVFVESVTHNATANGDAYTVGKEFNDVEFSLGIYDEPKREGYIFQGWSTDAESQTGEKDPTLNAATTDENKGELTTITLYAVWAKDPDYVQDEDSSDTPEMPEKYTVNYVVNGVTTTEEITLTEDNSYLDNGAYAVDYTLAAAPAVSEGQVFLYWKYGEEEYDFAYADSVITITSDTTFEAVFKNKADLPTSFTISYDANGGTGAPEAQNLAIDYNDDNIYSYIYPNTSVTISETVPTKEGYKFLYWETDYDYVNPGDTLYIYENTVLKAVWLSNAVTPVEDPDTIVPFEVNLKFDFDGATFSEDQKDLAEHLAAEVLTYDSEAYELDSGNYYNVVKFILPNKENLNPVKEGLTFKGWDVQITAKSGSAGDSGLYAPNNTLILTSACDVVIKPVFEEPAKSEGTDDKAATTVNSPGTGDDFNAVPFAVAAGVSAVTAVSVLAFRKKRETAEESGK